ncbi:hypothetical protein [Planomonospora sp. ID82291]|uniref:hypothetical protein n=1 Tax=Planomonospora sp. ID82291 TaxID=2738136 RepID=UPI0018C3E32D|nr:hypothetical protein [Planomonospora sp. ID82291]MBG0818195.1 hypothetical protein [Planomonospora sp. ID82291]
MADRSVSIRLRADVKGFQAGLGKAKRDTADLGRQMTETGESARRMRKRLEDATKALPKIEIDADSTPAELKFAQVRAEMEKLSEKRIGIDVDADVARAQIAEIERELEMLQRAEVDVIVRADIGIALAELRAVSAEADLLDGKTVTVRAKADVGDALGGLAMLSGAMAATAAIPVGAVLGSSLAALAGPLGAAGLGFTAFAAVAVPAVNRVNEAIDKGKIDELTKAEQELAKEFVAFGDAYNDWQADVSPRVWPIITDGLKLTKQLLPQLNPLIEASSGALGNLEKRGQAALAGPHWKEFLDTTTKHAPRAIEGLGTSFSNVFGGIGGILQALMPHTDALMDGLERVTQKWEDFGRGLKTDQDFQDFVLFVKAEAPQVWALIKNIAGAGVDLVAALAPLGAVSLGGLSLLADLVSGMDPGHIQAIAVAIGAVYLAVKSGQAINGAADAFGRLRDRMNDVNSAVGSGRSGIGGKIAGLAGMLGAGGPFGLAVGAGALVLGEFALANEKAAGEVRSLAAALGESQGAMNEQFKQQIGQGLIDSGAADAARKLGIELETLRGAALGNARDIATVKAKTDEYSLSLDGAVPKAGAFAYGQQSMNKEIYAVLQAIDGSNEKIASAREEYAQTTLVNAGLRDAYAAVKVAVDAAGGSMETSKGQTLAQRDAAEQARQKFSELATKVAETSNAQGILAGDTNVARNAFLQQIPALMNLAGANKGARDEVYKLASNFGINRAQADKAAKGINDVQSAANKLKSPPPIKITADTSPAMNAVHAFIRSLLGVKAPAIPIGIAAPKAYGGIFNPSGTQLMAQGGIRDLGPNPRPMIARSAYRISGRNGPDVIFGEAGLEAYIPLSDAKRGRGLHILQESARILGMAVVPEKMAINGPASTGGGGIPMGGAAPGSAMVTLTGIDSLRSALDTTAVNVTTSLGTATTMLDTTMGNAGSLTSALGEVGTTAGGLTAEVGGLAGQIDGFAGGVDGFAGEVGGFADTMGAEIPPLTESIDTLASAVSSAKAAADGKGDERNPRAGKSGDGSFKSASLSRSTKPLNGKAAPGKGDERNPRAGSSSGGRVASASLTKGTQPLASASLSRSTRPLTQPKTMIAGHVGTGSAGVAFSGGSGGTNWSKTSRPVQGVSSGSSSAGGSSAGGGLTMGGSTPLAGTGGLVQVQTLAVTEKADVDAVAAALYSRLGSKGR